MTLSDQLYTASRTLAALAETATDEKVRQYLRAASAQAAVDGTDVLLDAIRNATQAAAHHADDDAACDDDNFLPECDAGCGAECPDEEADRIRKNGTWTCRACDGEAAAEQIADARNDR